MALYGTHVIFPWAHQNYFGAEAGVYVTVKNSVKIIMTSCRFQFQTKRNQNKAPVREGCLKH